MPKRNQRRIAICKKTGKKVIQIFLPEEKNNNGWLCLHNDNASLDAEEVKMFEKNKKYNKNKYIIN